METKDNPLTVGVDRLNALIAWWGVPVTNGNGAIEHQMKRFQQFAADLQKTCVDAYGGEMDALLGSNDRLSRSIQELLRCRRPQEVLAAESEIVATLLEGASLQAKRWAEVTQKLQDCCTVMARDAATDLRRQAQESAPVGGDGVAEQQAAKPARRQTAQA